MDESLLHQAVSFAPPRAPRGSAPVPQPDRPGRRSPQPCGNLNENREKVHTMQSAAAGWNSRLLDPSGIPRGGPAREGTYMRGGGETTAGGKGSGVGTAQVLAP